MASRAQLEKQDAKITRAANMLREIDEQKPGERTVGARRADALECARACGLNIGQVGSEDAHPTIVRILAEARPSS